MPLRFGTQVQAVPRRGNVELTEPSVVDSRAAWLRLCVTTLLVVIGSSSMYVVSVVLPQLQADFGIDRSAASMPYAATMAGLGVGGLLMGRLTDRFGVMVPVILGTFGLGAGYVLAGLAPGPTWFTLASGVLIGAFGASATFSPLMADASLWFARRRGVAVAINAAGLYVGGALWPPAMQRVVEAFGWRYAYVALGVFCIATMLPLAMTLRRRPPALAQPAATGSGPLRGASPEAAARPLGLTPRSLEALLCIAGVACCVAMAMPQVHIVAYCTDLGFGPARGAEMMSLMLGFGIVSRLLSGWIADRIGGLRTLMLGSVLQGIALLLFLPFDGLVDLYVISALFGLFQGGIVPSYALIVREYFPPAQAGARVAAVLTATMFGMALGGWLSGVLFDLAGGYRAAFVTGLLWNLLNVSIAAFLLRRAGPLSSRAAASASRA